MALMTDRDLRGAVRENPPRLVIDMDLHSIDASVRGCAIDLHIGEVFRPASKSGEPGSTASPHKLSVTLAEGETAIVRTRESFKLDARHAAFVFPASSVSIQGLLMTNPGLVDPGYEGPVHVTVINMGREPYSLVPDGRLLRALVYDFEREVDAPKKKTRATITDELLAKLSPDFLSVGQRAASAAKREIDASVKRSQWLQFGFPAVATLFGVIITAGITSCTTTARYEERIQSLEKANAVDRLQKLELNYPTEKRLLELEAQLKSVRDSVPSKTPAR